MGVRTPWIRLASVCVGLLLATDALAVRVMTYNLLNYSSGRDAQFRTVLAETAPDVLLVEEILSQAAVNNFLNTVLNVVEPGEWAAGDFVNGADTDNGIFYKPATVQYVSHFVIGTALRDIDEWTVRPAGYADPSTNVRIYAVHLKASQGSTNEAKRLAEVTAMRNRMETFPVGEHYVVTGDFNIYTSAEPAYGYMLSTTPGLAGPVQDPINRPGTWHNLSAFADIHTQSPRTTQFGGGANGGMDDRFDMILVSPALLDGDGLDALPSTYTAFGQDGLHFNNAIIDAPPNAVVSAAVAQALHDGSDHLPVFVDLSLPPILIADAMVDAGTVIVGGTAETDLSVANGATPPADDLDYALSAPIGFSAPAGPFTGVAGAGASLHTIGMDTGTSGVKAGDLTITSDAPDDPVRLVPVTGIVLDHAVASLEAGGVVTNALIDFGVHATGGFSDQPASAHNVDYDALQALLDVYDATFAGDPRFAIVGGFSPATVGDTPASWMIRFDDAGAGDGTYAGTLTFSTRDQQDLSGAIASSDLVLDLAAEVSGAVDVADASVTPPAIGIHRLSPNPFRPQTTISFGVVNAGFTRMTVFDVGGRHVAELVRRNVSAGTHTVTWDGRDDRGRDIGAGVFYVRLQTPDTQETRVIVRVR